MKRNTNLYYFWPHILLAGILFCLLLIHGIAYAGCTAKDSWHGDDKVMHASAGFVVGVAATLANDGDWRKGLLYSGGVAVGKEAFDLVTKTGTCSLQDALVTAAAGALGSGLGVGLSVARSRGVTTVTLNKEF